jgi:hypothetical protein
MLQNTLLFFVLVLGIYSVIMSLVMNTKNFISALLFKVLPFWLGLGCVLYFLLVTGLIK